jgi:hypothetical protein
MHKVKKKGIQDFIRKPEHEEPVGRLGRIKLWECLKDMGW